MVRKGPGGKGVIKERRSRVLSALVALGERIYTQLCKGEFPAIKMPSRSVRNIRYDPELRQYVLGSKAITRTARNIKHLRPFTQLLWTGTFAKQLILNSKTSTLRDAFYNALGFDVDFEDQHESDEIVTELETILGTVREDFNIYPEERSSVYGPLTIEFTVKGYEGRRLDLTTIPDGAMIGPAMTTAEFVKCNASTVLVVEKGAVYQRFLEEDVSRKFKAVIIHTAGQAPRSTRKFIRRLNQELNLPVYIFTDGDVFGMHIASVIIYGSALAAHVTELNTPDAIWAGLYASDITKYKLPSMPLDEQDLKRLKELERDPRYTANPWKREIGMFWKIKRKAELESLSRYGLAYIVNEYLPDRIAEIEKR